MITIETIDDIVVNGGIVVTSDGSKIGSVEQVFLSEGSGEPAFVTVRTGLFGMSESFVPLAGATIDGSRIRVAFDKDLIKQGPRIDSDRGAITTDEESELYVYYGMEVLEVDDAGEDAERAALADVAVAVAPDITAAVPDTAHPNLPHPPPPPHRPHNAPPHEGAHPGPHPHPPHLLKHVVPGQPHHPPHPPEPGKGPAPTAGDNVTQG